MKKESQTIFDKNVIEFVTVAAEFCAFLERAEGMKRKAFVDTTLKILPLLYLKASMLPKCETIGDEAPETYVTEEMYGHGIQRPTDQEKHFGRSCRHLSGYP